MYSQLQQQKHWYVSTTNGNFRGSEYTTTLSFPLNQEFRVYISQEFERFQKFIDSILDTRYLALWSGVKDIDTIPLYNTFIVDASFLHDIKEYDGLIPLVIGNCFQIQLKVKLKNWDMGNPLKKLCTKIIMIPIF